ncbi:hypothetical protein [Aeoliella mucimassa]|uniref:PEP-CTERM protein-sorting domain-containing protein n=1 Tax=Aeoliella mucimassa TaxID=2527972 RepID=A0A518ATK0_9BACT|nr:hypothetical protein [Aeoliella mucimassa]QDU58060.1 hypothetical protein Pan181_42860 [Aeoliella mucimassa]
MKAIFSWLTTLLWVGGIWAIGTQASFALIIDSFDAGAYEDTDGFVDVNMTQHTLATTEVLGGAREVIAMWDGNFELAQSEGSFTMGFDGGMFEVSLVRYGKLISTSQGDYLNAEFTAAGHDRLRIDMGATTPGSAGNEGAIVRVSLFSGLESGSTRGSSAVYLPIATMDSYYLDIEYDWFQYNATGSLDMADIDGVTVELFAPASQTRVGEISIGQIATAAAPIAGDFNADGNVDIADYEVWKTQYGLSGPLDADGNGDRQVDLGDYTLWRDNLGASTPVAPTLTAVPEPATALLGLVAMVVICGARKHLHRSATCL